MEGERVVRSVDLLVVKSCDPPGEGTGCVAVEDAGTTVLGTHSPVSVFLSSIAYDLTSFGFSSSFVEHLLQVGGAVPRRVDPAPVPRCAPDVWSSAFVFPRGPVWWTTTTLVVPDEVGPDERLFFTYDYLQGSSLFIALLPRGGRGPFVYFRPPSRVWVVPR